MIEHKPADNEGKLPLSPERKETLLSQESATIPCESRESVSPAPPQHIGPAPEKIPLNARLDDSDIPPVQASPDTIESTSETEPAKSKKPAGEVFQELKNVVVSMDFKLDDITSFIRLAKDKLVRQSDEYVRQGKLSILESFFELHDMLFRRVMAMEAGNLEPDNFSIELMKYVQETLLKHGVDVIIPQPGDRFDMNYMESLRAVPAKFWRTSDTVANVDKCGYVMQVNESEEKILRPARVNVYRK